MTAIYPIDTASLGLAPETAAPGQARIRSRARSLQGMQKEALVEYGPTGTIWRLLCDEGPWLNGTDLAPFPLGFFCAGLAASYLAEFLAEARERGIGIEALTLRQDNRFTIEGSALAGTMAAGVEPVEVWFSASGDATSAELADVADVAVNDRSPANVCLRDDLPSRFAVRANGTSIAWPGEPADRMTVLSDPAPMFASAQPLAGQNVRPDLLTKHSGPPVEAQAIGLAPEQKRTVHVHSRGRLLENGLRAIDVQCIQPAGSRFTLLSDDSRDCGGEERAPNALTYLSAGVAFCFMTQLERYAQISKQRLRGYRLSQDTTFALCRDYDPAAFPVESLVCIDTDEDDEATRRLVHMGEQTCYLHAAYRSETETRVAFEA